MNTERLQMETLKTQHASQLFSHLTNKDIYTYIPDNPPSSSTSLEKHYSRLISGPPPHSNEAWFNWILLDQESLTPIGTLQCTVKTNEKQAYIAYVIFPDHWGKGYASEGVSWLLEFLNQQEIETAIAEIDTRNIKSISVVERSGFEIQKTILSDEGEDHVYIKALQEMKTRPVSAVKMEH